MGAISRDQRGSASKTHVHLIAVNQSIPYTFINSQQRNEPLFAMALTPRCVHQDPYVIHVPSPNRLPAAPGASGPTPITLAEAIHCVVQRANRSFTQKFLIVLASGVYVDPLVVGMNSIAFTEG